MLNDEKIIKKISEYSHDFKNNHDYVYACLQGGLKPNNLIKGGFYILIFIMIFIVMLITDNPIIIGALVGGIVGGTANLFHDYCVMIPEETELVLYVFNKTFTKVKIKIEVPYQEMELAMGKKRGLWHSIKMKTDTLMLKILISEKTVGLKAQRENSQRLIEKLNPFTKKEGENKQ